MPENEGYVWAVGRVRLGYNEFSLIGDCRRVNEQG